jgi:hypothetical protein
MTKARCCIINPWELSQRSQVLSYAVTSALPSTQHMREANWELSHSFVAIVFKKAGLITYYLSNQSINVHCFNLLVDMTTSFTELYIEDNSTWPFVQFDLQKTTLVLTNERSFGFVMGANFYKFSHYDVDVSWFKMWKLLHYYSDKDIATSTVG